MAALRSGLATLARRSCGCTGLSAATSMGERVMEIHQVLRPASPSLRPVAVRNLESWRRFSTEGRDPRDKADSFHRLVWQWAKYRVENASSLTKTRAAGAYALVVIGTPLYVLNQVTR